MKKTQFTLLIVIVALLGATFGGCKKEETKCGAYEWNSQEAIDNGFTTTINVCKEVRKIFAGQYKANGITTLVEEGNAVNQIIFNRQGDATGYYALLDEVDHRNFTFPDQYYNTGGYQVHLLSGSGFCNGSTIEYTLTFSFAGDEPETVTSTGTKIN